MLPRLLARLMRDGRGVSAVELALIAPVLLLLALGVVELGRFVALATRLQHAATTLADLATRDETLSEAALLNLFSAVRHVTDPFDMSAEGVAIVSAAGRLDDRGPRVLWQRRGAGALPATSDVGQAGGAAATPAALLSQDGDTVIAAEVYYRYSPWLLGIVPETTLRRVAYYRPRLGSLQELSP